MTYRKPYTVKINVQDSDRNFIIEEEIITDGFTWLDVHADFRILLTTGKKEKYLSAIKRLIEEIEYLEENQKTIN